MKPIEQYATERAREYRALGWWGGGADYCLGAYPGDREAWEQELGRGLDTSEVTELERAVRRALDMAAREAGDDD